MLTSGRVANHEDVAHALRRIAEPHQQLLASALDPDYAAHSGKKQWPTILSRAIVASAVPGDTPVKRKIRSRKSDSSSSRAEKPGAKSSVELEDRVPPGPLPSLCGSGLCLLG